MIWASLLGVDTWTGYWQEIVGAIGGLSVLASLPKVGPPVRTALLMVVRTLPPVAAWRIAAETERANLAEARCDRYKAALAELTAEVARLRDSGVGSAPSSASRKRRSSAAKAETETASR